jgi:hypothetical protein
MTIGVNGRSDHRPTEARLTTVQAVERAKWQATQERREVFWRCGIWIGDDGHIYVPRQTQKRGPTE